MAFSTSRFRRTLVAVAASGVMFAGLASAPAAHAYPPGKKPHVGTNKQKYKKNKRIKAQASRLKPGCSVRFTWKGKGFKKIKIKKVGKHGLAKASIKHGPRRKGKYRVYILQVKTSKCRAEKNYTTFRVRRK